MRERREGKKGGVRMQWSLRRESKGEIESKTREESGERLGSKGEKD